MAEALTDQCSNYIKARGIKRNLDRKELKIKSEFNFLQIFTLNLFLSADFGWRMGTMALILASKFPSFNNDWFIAMWQYIALGIYLLLSLVFFLYAAVKIRTYEKYF